MRFREWFKNELLNEVGTSTSSIANFSRMTIPMVRRMWPSEISFETKKKKNKKPYRVPQIEE